MRIKKYTAKNMREALLKIKDDLGEEAVILKTNKLQGNLFALGKGDQIEVTAAIDENAGPSKQKANPIHLADPGVYRRPRPTRAGDSAIPAVTPVKPAFPQKESAPKSSSPQPVQIQSYNEIKNEIRELKELVRLLARPEDTMAAGGFTRGWAVLYKCLVDSEVKPDSAGRLIANIRSKYETDDVTIDETFIRELERYFPVSGPIRSKMDGPEIVALVGPTGAGKTTTLAKLAAGYALEQENMVSVITADTYRIAAIEQIRTFADITGIALHVVFSPEEIPDALAACENDDFVFVDTAGRSQNNSEHMNELKEQLKVLHPDEVHLVLSATTKDSDLEDIVGRYREMNVNRLLFTKLDETRHVGNIYTLVDKTQIPVSYFTAGQSVPDDIEPAHSSKFMRRLWEGTRL
ncbi:MAG: flagellar biosynthesis protein FlhF [Chitinivibrionales bacterium]|nr:flagellar biosynthesis protein FlhF [Chitinivibrionales bacterium]